MRRLDVVEDSRAALQKRLLLIERRAAAAAEQAARDVDAMREDLLETLQQRHARELFCT